MRSANEMRRKRSSFVGSSAAAPLLISSHISLATDASEAFLSRFLKSYMEAESRHPSVERGRGSWGAWQCSRAPHLKSVHVAQRSSYPALRQAGRHTAWKKHNIQDGTCAVLACIDRERTSGRRHDTHNSYPSYGSKASSVRMIRDGSPRARATPNVAWIGCGASLSPYSSSLRFANCCQKGTFTPETNWSNFSTSPGGGGGMSSAMKGELGSLRVSRVMWHLLF